MKSDALQRMTLSQQVAQKLENDILVKLRPGDKLTPETELAKRFDVSVHTIREALSTFVREGVLERRPRRGTILCERKASRQHVALWVAVEEARQTVPNHWFSRLLLRLPMLLKQHEIRAKLYWSWTIKHGDYTGVGYDELMEDLSRNSIAAIATISGWWGEKAEQLIRQKHVPTVCNEGENDAERLVVTTDWVAVIRQGAEYLLSQGCRRIALLTWYLTPNVPWRNQALYQIFCEVLREHGVAVEDHWIRTDLDPNMAGSGYAEFREIWTARSEKPDGLLVTDDVLFQDVVAAISELGISVPSRLKVVATSIRGGVTCPGFPAARIEHDPDVVAQTMSEMLVKVVQKQPIVQREVVVPFRLLELAEASVPTGTPGGINQFSETKPYLGIKK